MKKAKKILAVLLCVAMVLSCSIIAAAADGTIAAPGTYSSTQAGRNGDVTITVTFDESSITAIEYSGSETETIGQAAIETLSEEVMEYQSIALDAIAGATISSGAFLDAVADCIEQAGGDVEAFSAPVEIAPVEYVTEADVVVVGAGGAGLSAAVTAAEAGASVILIEKSAVVGGNTAAAMSGINVLDSDIQLEAGVEYTEEEFVEMQTNELARENLVVNMIESSAETVNWLTGLGAELIPSDSKAYQVTTADSSTTTTLTLISTLNKALANSDVNVYFNLEATELVTAEDGSVTGVVAKTTDGEEITFSGKSVVLTTGGFGQNHEMVEELRPDYKYVTTDEIAPTTGDGIGMAVAVGAQTVDMDQMMAFPIVAQGIGMVAGAYNPGGRNLDAIMVNLEGERFTAESVYGCTDAVLQQTDGTAIMVFNESLLNDFLANYYELGAVVSGETPAELAEALGIDADALTATIAKWNEDCAAGTDTLFGRESNLNPLEGTLYAYTFNPGIHYCMGGILINESAQVLDADETPISGFYAAGEVTGGVHGTTRVDGTAVTDTFVYGRIAGNAAAEYALQ